MTALKFKPKQKVRFKFSVINDVWAKLDNLDSNHIYTVEKFIFDKTLNNYYISLYETDYFHLQDKFEIVSQKVSA